jgi:TonB family protein
MTLLIVLMLQASGWGQAAGANPPAASCAQPGASPARAELCLGEEQFEGAQAVPVEPGRRARQLEIAAEHFRRAVVLSAETGLTILALERLTQVYDPQHLAQPRQVESALRDLIVQQPNELHPAFRLAKLLEDEGLTDAAEETLLAARRQQPDGVEPYRMLAQFYARRATALSRQALQQAPPPAPGNPGERDENGVYRIGGPIAAPSRLEIAKYPPEAAAAGIQGNVLAEIVINESGIVSDAKIVRSIPILDEAALQAVRNWRFAPTMVDGQSVPVRMTVTVNFTTR